MTWYGVTGDRYDHNGHSYMEVGTFETQDHQEAMDKAYAYASSHPNAVAYLLRDGDPYLWVHHTYDLGLDNEIVYIKDCVYGHEEVRVNGKTVSDTRDCVMPSVPGWMLGEI